VPDRLTAALAARYEVRDELGRGGMATVYLAADLKHHREVAIKVLRSDLAASLGAERFLKEIEIAARLTHPHVLALYDSGEADGFLYYVMPYIEGGSLRQVLERERRLGVDRALEIAEPVADALGYAHRMGVLHRDIKPENILFSQGHPIVADFGIAKAISTAGGTNLTRTGFPLGTPGYMSPEQAAGLTDLDVRTDVFSLAVVVYEMLVGEVPGHWPSDEAVAAGRLVKAPRAHRDVLDALPRHVEAALVRAFAIAGEARTPSAEALMAELRGAAAPPTAARRVYSEEEVRELVRRASEAEVRTPTQGGALTIGGVQELAAEALIAPERIREAALALDAPLEPEPLTLGRRIVGAPKRILIERIVEGEVPEAEFPVLIEEIGRTLGLAGTVGALVRTVTWTSTRGLGTGRDVQISVGARAGRTRVSVGENLQSDMLGAFAGFSSGVGLGGAAAGSGILGAVGVPLLIPVFVPAWIAGVLSIARRIYGRTYRSRSRELERLADRLAALATQLVPRPRLPGA
jgi:predicted Ser/Thr protein kinase